MQATNVSTEDLDSLDEWDDGGIAYRDVYEELPHALENSLPLLTQEPQINKKPRGLSGLDEWHKRLLTVYMCVVSVCAGTMYAFMAPFYATEVCILFHIQYMVLIYFQPSITNEVILGQNEYFWGI